MKKTIQTLFGSLTLTHLLGGEPGWYMHTIPVDRTDLDTKQMVRDLGYRYTCGARDYLNHDRAVDFYHRQFPLSIASK